MFLYKVFHPCPDTLKTRLTMKKKKFQRFQSSTLGFVASAPTPIKTENSRLLKESKLEAAVWGSSRPAHMVTVTMYTPQLVTAITPVEG